MKQYEAITEMRKGNRVTHSSFLDGEFISIDKHGLLVDENNITLDWDTFWANRNSETWENNWSIVDSN